MNIYEGVPYQKAALKAMFWLDCTQEDVYDMTIEVWNELIRKKKSYGIIPDKLENRINSLRQSTCLNITLKLELNLFQQATVQVHREIHLKIAHAYDEGRRAFDERKLYYRKQIATEHPQYSSEPIRGINNYKSPTVTFLWAILSLSLHLRKQSFQNLIFVGLILISVHWQQAAALPAYDCDRPRLSGSYSLLALRKCREANPDQVVAVQEPYHVYEGLQSEEVTVKMCKIQVAYVVAYCGAYSHNSLAKIDSFPEIEIPSAYDCDDYHVNRRFTRGEHVHLLNMNATTIASVVLAGSMANDGTCEQGTITLRGHKYEKVFALANYAITIRQFSIMFDRKKANGRQPILTLSVNGWYMCSRTATYSL